ncbi:FMRFamide receptor-like [Gigantopelta aegis]|uniref:FMRFamide receptor-like n=1 Tax=Gigantopelta aegis TaxID=1735272 RepID=UPI001B889E11|nr:FMRFamide receptor-like [Gigantopelta aegis]
MTYKSPKPFWALNKTNMAANITTDTYLMNISLVPAVMLANDDTGNDVMSGLHNRSCVSNTTEEYENFYTTAQYVTGLVIYPILCVVGITGNTLALIVLNHRHMATSTNVYLSALTVSETIKLFNDLMYFIMLALSFNHPDVSKTMVMTYYPMAHYIFNMAVCITAWLTVSVAMERYISVCHISRAKQLCTISRARIICTTVYITMILLSLPSLFRYKVVSVYDAANNVSCNEIVLTELGANNAFIVPYSWIQNSVRCIIPLVVLVYLNVRIINELRKERVKGKKLSSRNRITLMLIIITLVFVVCIMPDAVMSTFFGKGYAEEGYRTKAIREITDSLLAVNSAITFMLYCLLSQTFRSTFIVIFCPQQQNVLFPARNGMHKAGPLLRRNSADELDRNGYEKETVV